jgi:hypothetical protein
MLSACATSTSASPVEGTISIPNGLGFGGGDDGIVVTFLEVTNDSRCPINVQCVRAGEAFVTISTSVDGAPPQASTHQMTPGETVIAAVDRFTIALLDLLPDFPPVGGLQQGDYELRIRIEKS